MQHLPDALAPLAQYSQFILYKLVPKENGKTDKLPVDYRTLQVMLAGVDWQSKPEYWTDFKTASALAAMCGPSYGVGFLFTVNDPFFFIDIDSCLQPDNTWSHISTVIAGMIPGAAIEVSQSGRGLHLFGKYSGPAPDHGCKNLEHHLELYTQRRFVALTGTNAIGNAGLDFTAALSGLVAAYFAPAIAVNPATWTTAPAPEWNGPTDDHELISKALESKSAGNLFGGRASFADLWAGNAITLGESFPDTLGTQKRAYDASSADAALAQHLAFWTGNDCERMQCLMWQSQLVRDKWKRDDYLKRTITKAVSLQSVVYGSQAKPLPIDLKGSDKQKEYAAQIINSKFAAHAEQIATMTGPAQNAGFWIENQNKTIDQVITASLPVQSARTPFTAGANGPEVLTGYQFLGIQQQIEHFAGCVYIQNQHRIFTPGGNLLKSEQFNAVYGGYVFQLDSDGGGKTTRKAWEAFTESQVIRFPKAESSVFRPQEKSGSLIEKDGHVHVNVYVPIKTPRIAGDVTPFINHLKKILPVESDQQILLAYMAACVQFKGVKFQWCPLLQGVEGNGKTLFTRCVAFAIGDKYTHFPRADEIGEKFNSWVFGNIFIGIEDVYVPDHKKEIIEILKPMITNDRLACRAMQTDQFMGEVCANFMLNSNHKNAIMKTRNDRRFSVFYTAQQSKDDLERDGMQGDYFPSLYDWLKGENKYSQLGAGYGYAVVANFLETYAIPPHLNPAKNCHRAPNTSSTDEAINSSRGSIEQEIIEAIEEGRPGFAGGWVSSMALEKLLINIHASRFIPPNKRREVLQSLGYDWHPALKEGRTNNMVMIDGGKPRLFIKLDHHHRNLQTAAEVIKAYSDAQGGMIKMPGH